LRAIKRHLATRTDALPWLFISERGQPLTRQAVNYLIAAAAERAGLSGVHPHTLRHSCGFALADKGHDGTAACWGCNRRRRYFRVCFSDPGVDAWPGS
jgi:site-specific recombinase XerD